jgi:hypothetical protein
MQFCTAIFLQAETESPHQFHLLLFLFDKDDMKVVVAGQAG